MSCKRNFRRAKKIRTDISTDDLDVCKYTDKKSYSSWRKAKRVLDLINTNPDSHKEGFEVYRCRYDKQHWHLGHSGYEKGPSKEGRRKAPRIRTCKDEEETEEF